MSDVEHWQEQASTLREIAKYTLDADAKRVLLMLAEDCEEISAQMTSFRGTLNPLPPDDKVDDQHEALLQIAWRGEGGHHRR